MPEATIISEAYSYNTLEKPGTSLFRDRGSKFIGLAFPLTDQENVKGILEKVKKEHPAARHYCYAWRTGPGGENSRSSDDGEPAGSAGKPIAGQFMAFGITNALVVVVRYFGGTLLGVGGLISAYRTAAASAIGDAGLKEEFVMEKFVAEFPDEDMSAVMKILKQQQAHITGTAYDQAHLLSFAVKRSDAALLQQKFDDLYRVKLEKKEEIK